MTKIVYLITEEEHSDYCGIGGSSFTPEIFDSEERALERYNYLVDHRNENSGFYYTYQEIKLNHCERII